MNKPFWKRNFKTNSKGMNGVICIANKKSSNSVSIIMSSDTYAYYLQAENLRYLLKEGRNLIGRDRILCQIHLSEKFLGRIHTSVIVNHNRCYIQISARHPVILNGRRIEIIADAAIVNIDLVDGDVITIHNYVFQLVKYMATNTDLDDTDRE